MSPRPGHRSRDLQGSAASVMPRPVAPRDRPFILGREAGSDLQCDLAALVEGIRGLAGGRAVADAVDGLVAEALLERIEGDVRRRNHEPRCGDRLLIAGQQTADGRPVAVPAADDMFGYEPGAEPGEACPRRAVGRGARDLLANTGVGGDDHNALALLGQHPGRADAAPVAALVED